MECPANWFVNMREGVRGETGREISPFFQSRQVKCAVRAGQWSRPFTCKDEVYGVSRVLWPLFRLQLRGTKAWRYIPSPLCLPLSLLSSLPPLLATLHVFLSHRIRVFLPPTSTFMSGQYPWELCAGWFWTSRFRKMKSKGVEVIGQVAAGQT